MSSIKSILSTSPSPVHKRKHWSAFPAYFLLPTDNNKWLEVAESHILVVVYVPVWVGVIVCGWLPVYSHSVLHLVLLYLHLHLTPVMSTLFSRYTTNPQYNNNTCTYYDQWRGIVLLGNQLVWSKWSAKSTGKAILRQQTYTLSAAMLLWQKPPHSYACP